MFISWRCGLYIPSGCVLSTTNLNGQLNINFNLITIASGASFHLGALGLSGGFRFGFPFGFNVYGMLRYMPADNIGFFLPGGSEFNFYSGATFFSVLSVSVQILIP